MIVSKIMCHVSLRNFMYPRTLFSQAWSQIVAACGKASLIAYLQALGNPNLKYLECCSLPMV